MDGQLAGSAVCLDHRMRSAPASCLAARAGLHARDRRALAGARSTRTQWRIRLRRPCCRPDRYSLRRAAEWKPIGWIASAVQPSGSCAGLSRHAGRALILRPSRAQQKRYPESDVGCRRPNLSPAGGRGCRRRVRAWPQPLPHASQSAGFQGHPAEHKWLAERTLARSRPHPALRATFSRQREKG